MNDIESLDPVKSGLEIGARIDRLDFQSKEERLFTVIKNNSKIIILIFNKN